MTRLSSTSAEDDFIARHFKPLATASGALGLTDDAAFYTPPPGHDLVLTKDALVAGVHFFADDPADRVARKALRVNLSDLAAKGAAPAGFLLALALPPDTGEDWVAAFARGLGHDITHYNCPLFGGDTVRTPGPVTISITAFGLVPSGCMVRRFGARPGDRVMVSGTIGDASLALRVRRNAMSVPESAEQYLRERYQLPQPRTALAAAVREHATAAMDVSDGLAGDLAKLCRVSAVSARIALADVPLSDAARTVIAHDQALLQIACTGGDDYEIVCTVPPAQMPAFRALAAAAAVPVSEIGEIIAGDDAPQFLDASDQPVQWHRLSFSHF
ncbi:MAG: thiamine-phosphate kinase [Pseudolabrys sp.]